MKQILTLMLVWAYAGLLATAPPGKNEIILEPLPSNFNISTQTNFHCNNNKLAAANIFLDVTLPCPAAWGNGSLGTTISNRVNGFYSCITTDHNNSVFPALVSEGPDLGPNLQLDCFKPLITLDGSTSFQETNLIYEWSTGDGNIVSGSSIILLKMV